jgi:hypothetical protein
VTGKVGLLCLHVCVMMSVCASAGERGKTPTPLPPLVINEVRASNVTAATDPQGPFDGWVEIYNAGTTSIDLRDMYLTRDRSQPQMWRIPAPMDDPTSSTIQPGGFLVIGLDGQTNDLGLHASFTLSEKGDAIYLFAANGRTLIDGFAFGPQPPDISYGRIPDGGGTLRYFAFPTPGSPNNEGYFGDVGPLRFSHDRGFYEAPFDLKIACETPDARILYSLDGSPPKDTGPVYAGSIRISGTTCLRVVAAKAGLKPTPIYTRTYVFGASASIRSLPLISLVGDSQNTFYEPNGVMAIVEGAGGYNNILNRDLERPVSSEWLFPANAADSFQIDCGLRVHGSEYMRPRYIRQDGLWSGNGKFSFRLYFRSEYGAGNLEYPLFDQSDAEKFDHIVLRAGHNDQTNPFIKDELLRRLYKDMGSASATGTFGNLFINGQYKGYYNPTEHVSEGACQEWFGSDKPWDIMTMSGIRDGDTQSWNSMVNFALTHDLSAAANYQYMASKLDIPVFIDYLIIRLWPNDRDWPQNNWSAAAERSDAGIWRFFVWDAEMTFEAGYLNSVRFAELNSQNDANGQLYRALKVNPDFRQLFNDRLYKHFYNGGTLTEGNIDRRFYELRDRLLGVIPNMSTYIVDTWTPSRQPIFLDACVSEGVYTFAGPAFVLNGAYQWGGHAKVDDLLTIVPPPGTLAVYHPPDGVSPTGSTIQTRPIAVTIIPRDAVKRVLVPTGPNIGNWTSGRGYSDSVWIAASGLPGGIGYDRNGSGVLSSCISTDVGSRMYGINGTCCIRIPFTVYSDSRTMTGLKLHVQYADGFVAYLNGIEIARRNLDGPPEWNSVASSERDDADAVAFETIDVSDFAAFLRTGNNMLAIQAFTASVTSPDFLITAELTAMQTPTSQNLPAGMVYYVAPIPLTRSVRINARALRGSTLSALSETVFAVGPVAESLRISEIMYHPADTGDPNDPNCEYLELTNVGVTAINLNLVRFTKGVDFTFGDLELAPQGRCLIVRDRAAFEARYGTNLPIAGQYQRNLSNAGERIELRDAAGTVIQSFAYRDDWFGITDGQGFSLTARNLNTVDPNAWSRKEAWRPSATVRGSPGVGDDGIVPELGSVVINEVMADPVSLQQGGDWIELHNTTDQSVPVGGWFVSDSADDLTKYVIASDTTIPAGGYLVLTEGGHFGNPSDPGCRRPFGLSRNGEAVYLNSGDSAVVTGYTEQATFGTSDPNVSFIRYPTGTGDFTFVAASEATPGRTNAYPQVGPIVINEIMYHPDGVQDTQYVELANISNTSVTLYDSARGVPWRLADTSQAAGVNLLLPSDPPITLAPYKFMLLVKDRAAFVARYGVPASVPIVEWTFGSLSDAGGRLMLGKPGDLKNGERQWITVDSVAFSDGSHGANFPGGIDPWPAQADGQGSSLVRLRAGAYGSDPVNWHAESPSPGTSIRRLILIP